MDIHAIAFDLDGTLVDSAGGIAHALNTALRELHLPDFDLGTVRGWIGDGPDALIARAMATLTPPPADPAQLGRLVGRDQRRWPGPRRLRPRLEQLGGEAVRLDPLRAGGGDEGRVRRYQLQAGRSHRA